MKKVQINLIRPPLWKRILRKKREFKIKNNEVFGMSQILGGAYLKNHRDSTGQLFYDKMTISSREIPTLGWQKEAISKCIEFLKEEDLIRVHMSALDKVSEKNTSVLYEISIKKKGIGIAANNRFTYYYKDRVKLKYKEELEISEKKATIRASTISFFALLISVVTAAYAVYSDRKVDDINNKLEKIKFKNDSLAILYNSKIKEIIKDSIHSENNKQVKRKSLKRQIHNK